MGGLGFIHLGFLAATAAVAVPIVLHLLLKPRARRMEIGTLRFLMLAMKDSTRHRRLRHWLLLALRTAALVLLALLFARPYLSGMAAEGGDREVVLLIDQSASMQAAPGGKSLFVQAQEAADKVRQSLPERTVVHLAYFDAQGVSPEAEAQVDRHRQAGFAASDHAQALQWARDRMVLSSRPDREVFLFTDLQRSGLRNTPIEEMPAGVKVEIVEAGKLPVRNLAVTQAGAVQTLLRPGQPITVTARIFNAGAFPVRDVPVRLTLEGAGPPIEQVVSVGAVAYEEVRFTPAVQEPGIYTGVVEVTSEDEFPLDNRRWLAFEVRRPDRLLLVDGATGRTVYQNKTYYLEAALRLRLPDKGPPLTPYEPIRLAWTEGTVLPELDSYRAVVLCNVSALGEADIRRLHGFLARGGRLLVFSGDRVSPEHYEPLYRAGLLPGRIKALLGPDLFRFAKWDRQHLIFRPLSDPQQGDLRRIAFHHLCQVEPAPAARVLASAQGGEPLLVEGRVERGTVLLFASAADLDWGDWPKGRLFVPLVHQMIGYLAERLPENAAVQSAPTGPGRDNPPGITRTERAVVVRNLDPRSQRWSNCPSGSSVRPCSWLKRTVGRARHGRPEPPSGHPEVNVPMSCGPSCCGPYYLC